MPGLLSALLRNVFKNALKSLELRLMRIERRQRAMLNLQQQERFRSSNIAVRDFRSHAFAVHSKCGEDGLLLHIFAQIGVNHRTFVEIGIQDGMECNTANLARHFGWSGLMLEGDPELAAQARSNYRNFPRTKIIQSFVTREHIARILVENGADLECDLFSLDIDGNDYWIWESLDRFHPRVVVAEYNPCLPLELPLTIRYDPAFRHRSGHPRGYFGASLAALVSLAEKRNYVLVGGSDYGCNAIFVQRQAMRGDLREARIDSFYRPEIETFDKLRHLDWVKV